MSASSKPPAQSIIDPAKVRVGVTTIVGWLVALAGFIPTIVQLLEGTGRGLTLEWPEGAAAILGALALFVTQAGRYWQANTNIKAAAAVTVAHVQNGIPVSRGV